MCISTHVFQLESRAFAVWALWSHLAIQNLFCHIAAWVFGERRLWVMSLQPSWGLYLPLHNCWKHPGHCICLAEKTAPSLHLPQSFLFQMV